MGLRTDTNVSMKGGGGEDSGAYDVHYGGLSSSTAVITTKGAMENGWEEVRSFFHARPKPHSYS